MNCSFLAPLVLLTLPLVGQEIHFPDVKWREKELDHFVVRTKSTGTDPAKRYAEKAYEVMEKHFPGLTADFEKNEFRTPNDQAAGRNDQFRFTIYLVKDGNDYHECLTKDAIRENWSPSNVNILKQTGNYRDSANRYMVIQKTDTMGSGGGAERDRKEIMVHNVGACLLSARARHARLPFWMTAGMGYYVEHQLFQRCSVYYLDFEAYFEANPDAIIDPRKGGTLGPEKPWSRILRKLCKNEERCSLDKTMGAEIITLSPLESGYVFALNYFMVSTPDRAKNYQGYLAEIRNGATPDKALLLKSYGYADAEAFEKDWYAWMMSPAFR